MARRSINGLRILVSGASSGIGRALAHELAGQGAKLLLTARREDRLRQLEQELRENGADCQIVAGDITDGALRTRLLATARGQWEGLDVVVNNAGVGAVGQFAEASSERLRRIMEVNFFAPAELIRESLPLLREGRTPLIVNVGSVLSHRAVPKKSEYCASKFALHGLTDALRAEFRRFGIDLLLVCPSTTSSEFFEALLEDRDRLPWLKWGSMTPRAVARKTVRAMRRGRQEVIYSPGGKMLVWADRLWPGLVNRLVGRFA